MNMKVFTTAFLTLTILSATTRAQNGRTDVDVNQREGRARPHADAGRLDSKTTGSQLRVSQLIGMNIYNQADKEIGEVNDVVLNTGSGTVGYLAVSYGGFLGLGDKMFAVPWRAFQVGTDPSDPNEYRLVLNVTEEQLKSASGFDQDRWPNAADRNFMMSLDKHYGVEHTDRNDRRGGVGVRVGRDGVDVDVKRDRE